MKKFKISLILIIICCFYTVYGQEKPKENLIYWGKSDMFLNKQTTQFFKLIHQNLQDNPPTTTFSPIRKSTLFNLDAILHDTRYDDSDILYDFINKQMKILVEDIKQPITEGIKIYKLYNDGFIVKSSKSTIAFDLVQGRPNKKPYISDSIMNIIVNQCDIMFVTHEHNDHADIKVAKMFAEAEKDVIVSFNNWEGQDNHIKQIRNETITSQKIKIGKSKIDVKILPGHQDDMVNNIYIVTTPEGYTVAHTGDQYNKSDLEWIYKIKDHTSIDVLLVNCWINQMYDSFEGFNSKLIITGHENEMAHSIDHREPYWLTYLKMEPVKKDYLIMTWGECYHYNRP